MSITSKKVNQFAALFGTNNKKALREIINAIKKDLVDVESFKKHFFTDTDKKTYNLVQILCSTDNQRLFFEWFEEYFDRKYRSIFRSNDMKRMNTLLNVIKKYLAKPGYFDLVYDYLSKLKQESIDARKEILYFLRERDPRKQYWYRYRNKVRYAFPDFEESANLRDEPLTDKEIELAIQSDIDYDLECIKGVKSMPQFKKVSYHKLWLEFFWNCCNETLFAYDEIIQLSFDEKVQGITFLGSYQHNRFVNTVAKLKSSREGLIRSTDIKDIDLIWEQFENKTDWFKDLDFEGYKAHPISHQLNVLLAMTDHNAFKLFYDVVRRYLEVIQSNPYAKEFFQKAFGYFSEGYSGHSSTSQDDKRREWLFSIGREWEELCRKIATYKHRILLIHPRLVNDSVPDIVVDQNIQWDENYILFADTIIECKKSCYFLSTQGGYEQVKLSENFLVRRYKNFCNHLEFWILQEVDEEWFEIEEENLTDIKLRYAYELWNDPDLPSNIQEEIKELYKKSYQDESTVEEPEPETDVIKELVLECSDLLFSPAFK